jgi:hypothetical protein
VSDAVDIEVTGTERMWIVIAAIVALGVVALFASAAWVGRERARQSVECVKAGGEWVDSECRRMP